MKIEIGFASLPQEKRSRLSTTPLPNYDVTFTGLTGVELPKNLRSGNVRVTMGGIKLMIYEGCPLVNFNIMDAQHPAFERQNVKLEQFSIQVYHATVVVRPYTERGEGLRVAFTHTSPEENRPYIGQLIIASPESDPTPEHARVFDLSPGVIVHLEAVRPNQPFIPRQLPDLQCLESYSSAVPLSSVSAGDDKPSSSSDQKAAL